MREALAFLAGPAPKQEAALGMVMRCGEAAATTSIPSSSTRSSKCCLNQCGCAANPHSRSPCPGIS
jgi:hypothetical protein